MKNSFLEAKVLFKKKGAFRRRALRRKKNLFSFEKFFLRNKSTFQKKEEQLSREELSEKNSGEKIFSLKKSEEKIFFS